MQECHLQMMCLIEFESCSMIRKTYIATCPEKKRNNISKTIYNNFEISRCLNFRANQLMQELSDTARF